MGINEEVESSAVLLLMLVVQVQCLACGVAVSMHDGVNMTQ